MKTDNTASSPEEAASIAAPSSKPKEAIATDASSKPEEAITASSSKPKEPITTAAFSKPEESITPSSTEHSDDFRRSQSSVKSSTHKPKTEGRILYSSMSSYKRYQTLFVET